MQFTYSGDALQEGNYTLWLARSAEELPFPTSNGAENRTQEDRERQKEAETFSFGIVKDLEHQAFGVILGHHKTGVIFKSQKTICSRFRFSYDDASISANGLHTHLAEPGRQDYFTYTPLKVEGHEGPVAVAKRVTEYLVGTNTAHYQLRELNYKVLLDSIYSFMNGSHTSMYSEVDVWDAGNDYASMLPTSRSKLHHAQNQLGDEDVITAQPPQVPNKAGTMAKGHSEQYSTNPAEPDISRLFESRKPVGKEDLEAEKEIDPDESEYDMI